MESAGTQCKCGLGFAKQFCGKGFAKPRLEIFEIRRDWVSAPQKGAGGMRGGFFSDFFAGGLSQKRGDY